MNLYSPESVRLVRVFVSSPGDLAGERGQVEEVLTNLNRLSHFRDRLVLRPLAYEALGAVPPVIGREPQIIVDDYMGTADNVELVICLFWSRMGSPVVLSTTGQRFLSGTHYEFTTAYQANRHRGLPHLLLYRCTRPAPETAQPEQVRLVDEFFQQIGATDAGTEFIGLFKKYGTQEEFAQALFFDMENLLSREFLPAPTLPTGPVVNIPQYDSQFFGREDDVKALRTLMIDEERGLVVITGTGGIGKTRLACEAARSFADQFPGGAYYIDVRGRETPERVSNAVAFNLRLAARLTVNADPVEQVGQQLAARPKTLLLLDNLEVAEKLAGETVARWRHMAPECRLLVTCRQVIPVEGAQDYRIQGLVYPKEADRGPGWQERLATYPAVRLFVDMARRGRHNFELTAANADAVEMLCHELQGQPLPLKLVAGRVRYSTPAELAGSLGGQFLGVTGEGESVGSVIGWSYDRLPGHLREVFCQLGVFRDGFTLPAARRVVSDLPGPLDLPTALGTLCDVSLLEATDHGDETRYWMFQTIQEFARDRVGGTHPPELRARWANYFADFAESQAAQMATRDAPDAIERLTRDRENLLAAQNLALEEGNGELMTRIVLGCTQFLKSRTPARFRIERLTKTLTALAEADTISRVRLLIELADAYWNGGDYRRAHDLAGRAAAAAENLQDDRLRAAAILGQAVARNEIGHRDAAKAGFLEALPLAEKSGDFVTQSYCLTGLGYIYDRWGNMNEALANVVKAVDLLRDRDNVIDLARAINILGLVQWHGEQNAAALVCFKEAEQLERRLGNARLVAGRVTNQALALTDLDQLDEAIERFEAGDQLHAAQENPAWRAVNAAGWGGALVLKGEFEQAINVLRRHEAAAEASGYNENIAFLAGNLGRAHLGLNQPDLARPLFERALRIQGEIDHANNRRYWGNLIQLAEVRRRAKDRDGVRTLLDEAVPLGARVGVMAGSGIRRTREDSALSEALATWLKETA